MELLSPMNKIEIHFELSPTGQPLFDFQFRNQQILKGCELGIECVEKKDMIHNFEIESIDREDIRETWHPLYGERDHIKDHYNQYIIHLKQHGSKRQLVLETRVYDEGFAYKYKIVPLIAEERVWIKKECNTYPFDKDYRTWVSTTAQGEYSEVTLSKVQPGCERPLVVDCQELGYIAIGEARLVDHSRMKFESHPTIPNCISAVFDSDVIASLPYETPWRLIMAADSPMALMEHNDIFLNLSEPCAIEDTSWIKPGKMLRDVTLTTQGAMASVDFARKHNLQYILFDAGWYGPENEDASDATAVSLDPNRSKGPFDLQEIIDYANKNTIGVILYVNRKALHKQLDEILPLYKSWGVAGLKYGFVEIGTQNWTSWMHEAVRKAAKHELLLDIHDEYRPSGYCRTYPNLLTVEGVRGDETTPSSRTSLTTAFTRMLCGPADHTVCYFDQRVAKTWTHAHQLAKAILIYSPLLSLYWYDRPEASPQHSAGAGGQAPIIREAPELQLFDCLPTVWDETRWLLGEIGRFAMVARRSGEDWFIAAMNADEKRKLTLDFDFLSSDDSFAGTIYSHDPTLKSETKVKISHEKFRAGESFSFPMGVNDGAVLHLTKI